ncbi:MAG: Uma2 family endonuclease, partial [Hymenobacter sp.]
KDKYDLYEENGVAEYWIVSPDAASISVFVREAATARYRLVGEYAGPGPVPCHTLPALGLHWQDVFPEAEGS